MDGLLPGLKSLYLIGLSHEKADALTRGRFSLSPADRDEVLRRGKEQGISALLVISTCNRTEIYGFVKHPLDLIQLLCSHTLGTIKEFDKVGYVYKNDGAIDHFFRVATGLDSQILGDFEITSQIRRSFKRSRQERMVNPFLDRLYHVAIQASRKIKNETELSSGATSVAFAAVSYMLNNIPDISRKHILLYGTGKIGRNTCENLVKHTKNKHITLINRTREKAELLGGKFNILVRDFNELRSELERTDILIVATGAQEHTITREMLPTGRPMLILDLSIPMNVSHEVTSHEHVELVHLDHLSQIADENLERRKSQVPAAEVIIENLKFDFYQWLEARKYAPVIKALKAKLKRMKEEELDYQSRRLQGFDTKHADVISDRIIEKITRRFANHLKASDLDSDESLEFIQKVFQLEMDS